MIMARPEGSSGVQNGSSVVHRLSAPPSGGPTVPRRLLGAQLRRLREERRITLEDAGNVIRASGSKMSRLETGRVGFKDRDITDLLAFYEVTDEQQCDALRELARNASAHGWWHDYSDVLPAWFEAYVGLEEAATSIRTYEIQFVPGLLQTEDYARAVMTAVRRRQTPEEIDRLVELRMQRQAVLHRPDPLELWLILDEAVLWRMAGPSSVMCQQLDHLYEASQWPNVTLQILRFTSGLHPALGGSFCIIEFPERLDPDVLYTEGVTGQAYIEERDREVRAHAETFDLLRASALPPAESALLVRSISERSA
jgi:transcriptional regulator with XRE-family HTH domain